MNPYHPLNDYIPDGEPHIFEQKLIVYGSHDEAKGNRYCPLDYVAYYCDLDDLEHWKCSEVLYRKTQDPLNQDGKHDLYAPDVVQGFDGRYYLYYGLEGVDAIRIAVSDHPLTPFEYYGTVSYPKGCDLSKAEHYPSCFDPAVLMDEGHCYLSLGFSLEPIIATMNLTDQNTRGAYVVELEQDMKTMKHFPKLVVPGYKWGKGTGFEGHEFLEASSLRKFNDTYYFIYSSQNQHELCYATSRYPDHDFIYQGVLISNASKLKETDIYENDYANNHGSIVQVGQDYYLFYHRHTYGHQFSRQGCVEKIEMDSKGHFKAVRVTSMGMKHQLLPPGNYPAAIACGVYDVPSGVYLGFEGQLKRSRIEGTKITHLTKSVVLVRSFSCVPSCLTLELENQSEGTLEVLNQDRLLTQITISKLGLREEVIPLTKQDKEFELRLHFNFQKEVILHSISLF